MWIIPAIFLSMFLILVLIGWINMDLDTLLDEHEEELRLFKDVFTRLSKPKPDPQPPYMWYLTSIVVVIVMVAVIYFIVTRTPVCSIK